MISPLPIHPIPTRNGFLAISFVLSYNGPGWRYLFNIDTFLVFHVISVVKDGPIFFLANKIFH